MAQHQAVVRLHATEALGADLIRVDLAFCAHSREGFPASAGRAATRRSHPSETGSRLEQDGCRGVMRGSAPRIHPLCEDRWIAGSSPAMTTSSLPGAIGLQGGLQAGPAGRYRRMAAVFPKNPA
jgi:hypothetical protein